MVILFYKARYGRWYDRLLVLFIGGPYSHVELELGQLHGQPICISSSPRDGGVRAKLIQPSIKWDVLNYPLSAQQQQDVLSAAIRLLQKRIRYDWFGLLGRRRMHCSELVVTLLQHAGELHNLDPKLVTPTQLYNLTEKKQ